MSILKICCHGLQNKCTSIICILMLYNDRNVVVIRDTNIYFNLFSQNCEVPTIFRLNNKA